MEELREHQIICTEALEELARVCTICNIPYYLLAGSCLGAVRHNGFIPWDDDIDVGIRNEDYEKFEEAVKNNLSSKFQWIDNKSNASYPRLYGKILHNKSACVDVFRLVQLPKDEKKQKKIWRLRKILYKLYYRKFGRPKMVNVKIPEFNDYNYSKTNRKSVKWMEIQANAIPRYIQLPLEQVEEVVLDFFENLVDEPDWNDYRDLIDHVKCKFGTAWNTAKKIIVELGWKEVRGVYVYNVAGYVDDYDVDFDFPDDHTYTLSLRHVSEITEISDKFADLVNSGHFIYLDGHVILGSDTYVEYLNGHPLRLTDHARRHMSECCLDFKRTYDDPK